MSNYKPSRFGVYGPKTRLLQQKLSFERTTLSWKSVLVWKYLGSRTNDDPSINDIGSIIFMETPDRAYDSVPVRINAAWEPIQEQMVDLSAWGIINPLGDTMKFMFHSYSFTEEGLGRYIVVGDVLEVPFMEQDNKKAFFEVTDVDRKQENENYRVIVTTVPIQDRQETEEIHGVHSNRSIFDDIMDSFDDEVSDMVPLDGYDTDGIVFDDNPVRGGVDPRTDDEASFLDDPTKPMF